MRRYENKLISRGLSVGIVLCMTLSVNVFLANPASADGLIGDDSPPVPPDWEENPLENSTPPPDVELPMADDEPPLPNMDDDFNHTTPDNPYGEDIELDMPELISTPIPDLVVLKMTPIEDSVPLNTEVELNVVLENIGIAYVEEIEVAYYLDEISITSLLAVETAYFEEFSSEQTVFLSMGELGLHTILAVIDPYDSIVEEIEDNNALTVSIEIASIDSLTDDAISQIGILKTETTNLLGVRGKAIIAHLNFIENKLIAAENWFNAGKTDKGVINVNLAIDMAFLVTKEYELSYSLGRLSEAEAVNLMLMTETLIQTPIPIPDTAINTPLSHDITLKQQILTEIMIEGSIQALGNHWWGKIFVKLAVNMGYYQLAMFKLAKGQDADAFLDNADASLIEVMETIETYAAEGKISPELAEWSVGKIEDARAISPPDLTFEPADMHIDELASLGKSSVLTVKIWNIGDVDTSDVLVFIYDETEGVEVGTVTIPNVPNGGFGEAEFYWTPTQNGTHYIRVSADPEDMITESDENNNEARCGFYVVPGTTYIGPVYVPFGDVVDWTAGNTTISGKTIVVSGDIVIDGTLLVGDDITVIMNCTVDGEYKIQVNPTGELNAITGHFASPGSELTYSLLVGGELNLYWSTVQWLWGDTTTFPNIGGLQLYSNDVFIFDTEIFESKTHGVYVHLNRAPEYIGGGTIIRDNGISGVFFRDGSSGNVTGSSIFNQTYGIYTYQASPTIKNSEIRDNTDSGVYCYYASPTITGNTITNNYHGVLFEGISSALVTSNTIERNSEYGIKTKTFASPTILNNPSISNSTYGIYAFESSPTVDGNAFFNNAQIGVIAHTSSSLITRNMLLGNPNYGVENYLSPAGGLVASENTIRDSFCGFYSFGSSGRVENNPEIADNSYGIYLQESPGYAVENNVIDGHTHYGILANQSENTAVRNCSMANNSWGVYFGSSSYSSVSDNCTITGGNGTYATNSHDIVIRDSTIKNGAGTGILYADTTFSAIENCTVANKEWGIFISGTSHNIEVNDCTVTSNRVFGVYFLGVNSTSITNSTLHHNNWAHFATGALHIRGSRDCTVDGCQFRYNGNLTPALLVDISTNITIKNNVFEDNRWMNIYVGSGMFIGEVWEKKHYNHTIDTSNLVNGRPVYYFFDLKDQTIENLIGGHFTFAWCENVTVKNCDSVGRAPAMRPASVSDPIYLVFTNDSKVNNCSGFWTVDGIWLYKDNNVSVVDFDARNIYWAGILIEESLNCSFARFFGEYCCYGVLIQDSKNVYMRDSEVYWSAQHILETMWKTDRIFGIGVHIETSSDILAVNCTSTMSRDGCFNLRYLNNATFMDCKSGDYNGFIIYYGNGIRLTECLSIKGGTGISCSNTVGLAIDNYTAHGCIRSITLSRNAGIALRECSLISDWPQSVGLYLDNCTDGAILDCQIEEQQWGILIRTSNNISITGAEVTNGGPGLPPGGGGGTGTVGSTYGIDIGSGTSNTSLMDCALDGSHYGVVVRNSMVNCSMYNTTVSDTNYSALYSDSSKLNVQNATITGSNQTAVQSYGSVLNMTNSSISMSNLYDFYMDACSNITTLNTTFNKVRVQYIDGDSSLTVRWFMHVHVVLPDLSPISGASVEVSNVNDNAIFTGASDIDGTAMWIKCTEYFQTSLTTSTFYTPYNVSASKWAMYSWASPEPQMNRSSDVYVVLGGSGYNIFLHEGWNLISIPYQPYDMSSTNIAVVLQSIEGRLESVRWFDPIDTADPWKIYRPGSTMNDLNHIDHTMGLWVSVTMPCTLVAMGEPEVSTGIQLFTGWNMVGYTTNNHTTNVSTAFASIDGYRDLSIEGYDASVPTMISPLPESYIMRPGEGYWVHVNANCTWTVDW